MVSQVSVSRPFQIILPMTEATVKFPPLWPGSTATTLPRRTPVPVGRNSAGPPLATSGCAFAEAALLPGAGSGGRLADWVGEVFALDREAAGSLRWEAGAVAGDWP